MKNSNSVQKALNLTIPAKKKKKSEYNKSEFSDQKVD